MTTVSTSSQLTVSTFPPRTKGRNTSRTTPVCSSWGRLPTSCLDRGPWTRYDAAKSARSTSDGARISRMSHLSLSVFMPAKFEPGILEACLNLLNVSPQHQRNKRLDYLYRNNPVYIGRVVSAMVRTQLVTRPRRVCPLTHRR